MAMVGPASDIVAATHAGAVDGDVPILVVGEILLDDSVRAVGVAHQHVMALRHDPVKALS